MPSFSSTSGDRLATCHPDLQRLFNEVIKHRDCTILEGHRDMERQKELFRTGKSKTLASRHLSDPSEAVDVCPYPIDWEDKERFIEFAGFVMGVATMMNINIEWGGHFKSFFDGPHYQLEKK